MSKITKPPTHSAVKMNQIWNTGICCKFVLSTNTELKAIKKRKIIPMKL